MTPAPVSTPPAQPTQGRDRMSGGLPRGGSQSGGGQAYFFAFPARSEVVASDVVIISIGKSLNHHH